jgi:NAD(P)-dependent dehydrogenase (short-subunit alcohol dehydrogenase family)
MDSGKDSNLAGRHVVVTGARGGLGGAVVKALRARGAVCHLPQRGPAPASEAGDAGINVIGGVDLTDEAAVRAFYEGLPALWASVHLAGGYAGAPLVETPLALLRGQLDVNLVTAFLCCREAVRALRTRRPSEGRIVNVTSRAALEPSGGSLAYAAAKAGVVALTRGLAAELREEAILVNAVAPATIDTPRNRNDMPGADTSRWATPESIAEALLWLISPSNTLVSGAVVPVYGRG